MSDTPEPPAAPSGTVITTKTKDHLGRLLSNIAVDARDYLGRATQAGDLDYAGEALA